MQTCKHADLGVWAGGMSSSGAEPDTETSVALSEPPAAHLWPPSASPELLARCKEELRAGVVDQAIGDVLRQLDRVGLSTLSPADTVTICADKQYVVAASSIADRPLAITAMLELDVTLWRDIANKKSRALTPPCAVHALAGTAKVSTVVGHDVCPTRQLPEP